MIVRVTTHQGETFYLRWENHLMVAGSAAEVAKACAAYLNGTPAFYLGQPNPGGTDTHYEEQRPLRSREEFLLIAGSLQDRFTVHIDLVGELSDADHEQLLANPVADALLARCAIKRAVACGMERTTAEALYGIRECN